MARENKADKVYKAVRRGGEDKATAAKIAQAKTGQPLKSCSSKKGKK